MAASLWTSRCTGNCSNVVIYNLFYQSYSVWLPQGLVTALLIIEAVPVVMEPLFGGLSDQAQRWISRFLFVAG